jgi:hypothetical protein
MSVFEIPEKDINCIQYEIVKNDGELKNTCETIEQYKTYSYYHPICLNLLKENHRESYRKISKEMHDNYIYDKEYCPNKVITFENALAMRTGIIITENEKYIHGGCSHSPLNKAFSTLQDAVNYRNKMFENTMVYPKVISIASFWAEGGWHFPMEAMVGLKLMKDYSDAFIHINKKSDLTVNWIKQLGLNIDENRIIDGHICAKKLIIPQLGKCGNPYYDQLIWLRKKIIGNLSIQYHPKAHNPQNLFILIKRNYRRTVQNYKEMEDICKAYCKKHQLSFWCHDDFMLPSLSQQFNIFNKAKIVVAPEGAGNVNLIASCPKTILIELSNMKNINTLYHRMVNLLGMHYLTIPYMPDAKNGLDIQNHFVPVLEKATELMNNEQYM